MNVYEQIESIKQGAQSRLNKHDERLEAAESNLRHHETEIGELKEKVDAMDREYDMQVEGLKKRRDDHAARLRALEATMELVAGRVGLDATAREFREEARRGEDEQAPAQEASGPAWNNLHWPIEVGDLARAVERYDDLVGHGPVRRVDEARGAYVRLEGELDWHGNGELEVVAKGEQVFSWPPSPEVLGQAQNQGVGNAAMRNLQRDIEEMEAEERRLDEEPPLEGCECLDCKVRRSKPGEVVDVRDVAELVKEREGYAHEERRVREIITGQAAAFGEECRRKFVELCEQVGLLGKPGK